MQKSFDIEKGILTIKSSRGDITTVEGFKNIIYHDNNFIGDGSKENPLKLKFSHNNGQHHPVIKIIDTETEHLPTENLSKNDRYLTKEKNSIFGALYPLYGVKKIQEKLKEIKSKWRVASKEDWEELLNTIDIEEAHHNSKDINISLGIEAGSLLKSLNYWKNNDKGELLSEDKYGFNLFPVGYAGNRGINFYGSFGESAAYWTSTEKDDKNEFYIKRFEI